MDLLERLIEEAKLHGRTRLELEIAKETAREVGSALSKVTATLEATEATRAAQQEFAQTLATELQESRENERAALVALRDVTLKIDSYNRGRQKRGAKADLAVAKGAAQKFVAQFEARRPGVLDKVEVY
jgi:hypothetical protein